MANDYETTSSFMGRDVRRRKKTCLRCEDRQKNSALSWQSVAVWSTSQSISSQTHTDEARSSQAQSETNQASSNRPSLRSADLYSQSSFEKRDNSAPFRLASWAT